MPPSVTQSMGYLPDVPPSIWHTEEGYLVFRNLVVIKLKDYTDAAPPGQELGGYEKEARKILLRTLVEDDVTFSSPPPEIKRAVCSVVEILMGRVLRHAQAEDFRADGHKKLLYRHDSTD